MCYDISFSSNIQLISDYLPDLVVNAQLPIDFDMTIHVMAQAYRKYPVIIFEDGDYKLRPFEWGVIADYMNTPEKIKQSRQYMCNAQSEKIIISKNGYEISIYQAAAGGNQCTYPGDPTPQGPAVSFAKFVEITTQSFNKLRRSQGTAGFTVCELLQNTWMTPTSFGHIAIKTPLTIDPTIMTQVDAILTSLKKI